MSHTILYARVSTAEQTIEHQLEQAVKAGFQIDETIWDDRVSGISTRLCERSQGKRLYDKLRAGDVLVVRWVDRLGRNYADVTGVIREFMERGVIIKTVINGMVFDGATQDPMQMAVRDALISFLAATAQAQAESIKESQKAGIAYAKKLPGKYRGRKPSYSAEQIEQVVTLLETTNPNAVAKSVGLSRQAVLRIAADPDAAYARVAKWQ
jgi:DNA invertase Pin-like site-specific DNA recombinase